MSEVASEFTPSALHASVERRRGARHLTLMRVGLIHCREGKEFCLIRNLSSGGLMAQTYRRSRPGEEVHVELTTGHILVGDVVWARGLDIGVQFRGSIDVSSVLSTRWGPEFARRPRLPRLSLSCPASVRHGSLPFTVQVQNISQHGAKIVATQLIPNLTSMVLSLPNLPVIEGTVRWSRGDEAGLFFKGSLPFPVLARWVDGRRQLERSTASTDSLSFDARRLEK